MQAGRGNRQDSHEDTNALFHCDAAQGRREDRCRRHSDRRRSSHLIRAQTRAARRASARWSWTGGLELTPLLRGGGQEKAGAAAPAPKICRESPGFRWRGGRPAARANRGLRPHPRATRQVLEAGCRCDRTRRSGSRLPRHRDCPTPRPIAMPGVSAETPSHRPRSRWRHGQRRSRLLFGQGRPEPCAPGDGSRTRSRRFDDPGSASAGPRPRLISPIFLKAWAALYRPLPRLRRRESAGPHDLDRGLRCVRARGVGSTQRHADLSRQSVLDPARPPA